MWSAGCALWPGERSVSNSWTSSVSPYAMQVMLGEHDVRVSEATEQLMKTDTIIWHPE